MNSVGYKNLKVKSIEELEQIEKPEFSIEFLCGNIGAGKTYIMDEFYKNNKKIIYIKSHLSNDDIVFIDLNNENNDLLNKLNSITNENILIYEHNNIAKLNEIIEILINFAKENEYTLMLDIDKLNSINFLINIENINIIVSTINKNIVNKSSYKLPVIYSEVNYRKVAKMEGVYSGNISLRLPKSLHYDLSKEANLEGVSLNQYLLYVISSRRI